MRLPVWPNLLPNISFLMRSVGSIETIMTRTPGTLWDPIRLQGVSGLIGKHLPADHNQIVRASINLSPTPFASITIISHILWISVSSPQPQAIDLEPIDFEHFLDEPDLERSHHLEKMFMSHNLHLWKRVYNGRSQILILT